MLTYFRISLSLSLAALIHSLVVSAEPTETPRFNLPPGFRINIFAKLYDTKTNQFESPRMMAFDKNGQLYVSIPKSNLVVMLPDINKDGISEAPVIISDKLNAPNGIAFVGDSLLVANQDGVVKLTREGHQWSDPKPLINNLPTGGAHSLKTIKVGPDGYLYINVGSTCNVCAEQEATRATILRYTIDGKPAGALLTVGRHEQSAIWATGLRNSQGFAWQPATNVMYATNDGADNRSDTKNGPINDEIPPENLNLITPGKNYGWPYCWWTTLNTNKPFADPNFSGDADFCKSTQSPAITFTAHTTPIGITFLDESNFPKAYKNDAIVALHGSWNRKQPAGYKLVRVKFSNYQIMDIEDFTTGWLDHLHAWGRPVDVAVGMDGALYISDDWQGIIYRVSYIKKTE